MKFFKTLFRKTSHDNAEQVATAPTGTLPPIDMTRTTRPIMNAGNGDKKPKVGKLTLYMLLSDISAKCLEYVKEHAERGNPTSVINCIDEFTATNRMMNIGDVKGAVIDEEIRKKKPTVMAELGAYTGYSAVRFASLQREVAGQDSHYHSFEYSPVFADRVREMVDFAGLTDQVTVYVGAFSEQYEVLRGKTVDLYFIDHEKSVYLSDLKLILGSGTLASGSVIAADNVVAPGAPDYLKFIENSSQFSTVRHSVPIKLPPFWRQENIPDLSVATFTG
ncbi:Catechol O-methyltransferase [Phytophthora citrophthora]|uniref:catechol O-methyltransferase n=1 Tax=Phytophthora citrophthora TaxID=4793 RepID=A0AAD9GUK5_9STRA|nr:Catechol O-methyltransferase [Phytophthora citrophthora]